MTDRYLRTIPVLLLLLFAYACSQSGMEPPADPGRDPGLESMVLPGGSAELIRDASGLPSGILVSWDPVPDGADEAITGYHIYRSGVSMDDASRGQSDLWLVDELLFNEDGDGNSTVFPATALQAGERYSYLDEKTAGFELNIGETWFYRISALNDNGDEGLLSAEVEVTISQHLVESLSEYSGFVGDEIVVYGVRFGEFDDAIDDVTFAGRVWNPNTNPPAFENADIQATITSWSSDEISVVVPQGATAGRLRVWIDGVQAVSLQEFECLSPYLTEVSPYDRFLDQTLTIKGANFGEAFGPDNLVLLDGNEVTEPGSYLIYGPTQISFRAPAGTPFGETSVQVRNGTETTEAGFFNILNRSPVAEFSMNTNTGAVPLSVVFNAEPAFDLDDGIAEWKFEFGDGTEETRTSPDNLRFNHLYESVGNKSVTLTVTDFAGATDSITKTVTVVPAAEILVVSDQFNGAGPGNEFTANFIALTDDLDRLGTSYVVGGYSVGISQVAIDQGFQVVIWNRGGPGPGDRVQDWPRNWNDDEKNDFMAILNAGIPTLLLSQNHQFTADFSQPHGFDAYYGISLQNDTVVETGPDRDFPWVFGTPTDYVHTEISTGAMFPSSPVCLLNDSGINPTLNPVDAVNAAEQYTGTGSSGFRPQTLRLGIRIQGAMLYDPATKASGVTHPNFIPGLAPPDGKAPFSLCFSYGLDTAPDADIGFAPNYSHANGPSKLWVIGWSYSEAVFGPDPIQRHHVLQNVLAWLDSSLTLP